MPDARRAARTHSPWSSARNLSKKSIAGAKKATGSLSKGIFAPPAIIFLISLLTIITATGPKLSTTLRVTASCSRKKAASGIGTFQPKDEKNQDSTELTGDINYRKIAEYGSDSDPRAFNFDGEFNIANRGIIEFIEVLKLDVAFLYDLLGRFARTQG